MYIPFSLGLNKEHLTFGVKGSSLRINLESNRKTSIKSSENISTVSEEFVENAITPFRPVPSVSLLVFKIKS